MAYTINDKYLIDEIEKYRDIIGDEIDSGNGKFKDVFNKTVENIKDSKDFNEEDFKETYKKLEHPLDNVIIEKLKSIIGGEKQIPYSKANELDNLWCDLLRKSINCLRFFDHREPFMLDKSKKPFAHGIDQLELYHQKYTKFEGLLYGASEYYRDHVFHSVRTWLIGIFCLLHKEKDRRNLFIDCMEIDGITEKKSFSEKINFFEKISMWTISALCHDLGYPLEKSQQILDRTKDMMREFVSNPTVFSNFAFNGIQDSINEYIVKFMSTKMKKFEPTDSSNDETEKYLGRIQPKYFLKYTKSLEKNDHGIISAIIIYKMLLYFLESDFNLNDDYTYTSEDARQFYIRREILRSIASHTCTDIYNIKNTTFSSLLYICDEMQEWGRKSWNELYTNINPDSIKLSIENFNDASIKYEETVDMETVQEEGIIIDSIFRLYTRQFDKYQLIFRDGQHTNSRTFNLNKKVTLNIAKDGAEDKFITIDYCLLAKGKNTFNINLSSCDIDKSYLEDEFKKRLKCNLPETIIVEDTKTK